MKDRLNIPLNTEEWNISIPFYTESGLFVAKDYGRVVIGQRGPYIEFNRNQIEKSSFFIPENQQWRLHSKWEHSVYYIEFRSNDESYIKLYYQQKEVKYADYVIGKMYISPFDLTMNGKYPVIR